MKKKRVLPIIMLMCIVLLCACNYNRKSMKNEYVEKDGEKEYAENTDREADTDRQIEKGYDLPIDARQRAEAEEDCKEMMGLPKGEFERLIMEYLPVTAEEIQDYAAFDKEKQTYAWVRLGCFNYAPAYFGTSFPEVTDIRENEDGTVTLTVDAVCSMILCDDAVITHELTVRFSEDGGFQYLGNKILDDGISNIPDYQYRIVRE
jgi:hypothetical protein